MIGKRGECVRLPEWTGMDRITGMDYRNGLLHMALSACNAFYMHRKAYRRHRG